MSDPRNPVLLAFLARELPVLAELGGLAPGLALTDVAAALGADPEIAVRWFLGDPPLETFWCPANDVTGFDDRIRIWFRGSDVVKVDGGSPQLDVDAAEVFGPPELQLDHRMSVLVVEGGERVWPSKGIALKVNRSGTKVVGLSIFPPTTADDYRATVKDVEEYRESPAGEVG